MKPNFIKALQAGEYLHCLELIGFLIEYYRCEEAADFIIEIIIYELINQDYSAELWPKILILYTFIDNNVLMGRHNLLTQYLIVAACQFEVYLEHGLLGFYKDPNYLDEADNLQQQALDFMSAQHQSQIHNWSPQKNSKALEEKQTKLSDQKADVIVEYLDNLPLIQAHLEQLQLYIENLEDYMSHAIKMEQPDSELLIRKGVVNNMLLAVKKAYLVDEKLKNTLSVYINTFNHMKLSDWEIKIFSAMGFPKTEKPLYLKFLSLFLSASKPSEVKKIGCSEEERGKQQNM